MALTVVPNEDGSIDVMCGGEELTLRRGDIESSSAFTKSEEAFLLSMLRYAVPEPVSCRIPDYPPDE